MNDLVTIAVAALFFALAWWFVGACQRI